MIRDSESHAINPQPKLHKLDHNINLLGPFSVQNNSTRDTIHTNECRNAENVHKLSSKKKVVIFIKISESNFEQTSHKTHQSWRTTSSTTGTTDRSSVCLVFRLYCKCDTPRTLTGNTYTYTGKETCSLCGV